ncbi:DUF6207 family protein [Streptomyces sp. ISL-100]|uniref:DUF6207 family protein n=1 Tax=Streptomyces sp. ISL-100 TaxID=2819173 RepID=UPI002035E9DD|nr:DUF6207 family protein [Streptomyces sp. ISL-100]
MRIDEQHIAEPGLVVLDVTAADEETLRAVLDGGLGVAVSRASSIALRAPAAASRMWWGSPSTAVSCMRPYGYDPSTAGQDRAQGGAASQGKGAGDGEERPVPDEAGDCSEARERDMAGSLTIGHRVHGGVRPRSVNRSSRMLRRRSYGGRATPGRQPGGRRRR